MSGQTNPHLAAVADMRGAGVRMAIGFDSKSKPGFIIVHQVQLHTLEVKNDASFGDTVFQMFHGDNDRRIPLLQQCFLTGELGGQDDAKRN